MSTCGTHGSQKNDSEKVPCIRGGFVGEWETDFGEKGEKK